MADLYPKELNWEAEYSADPKAAHDKEKVYQHVRGRMTSIAQEMQREQAEAQAQYQAQAQAAAQQEAAYAEWGKQEFRRRTGITDTATLNNEYQRCARSAWKSTASTNRKSGPSSIPECCTSSGTPANTDA